MVRGSDRPELRLQRPFNSAAPSRQDTSGVNAGEHGSHTHDKKKWRRVQQQTCPSSQFQGGEGRHLVRIRDVSEAYSDTLPAVDLEGLTGTEVCNSRLSSSFLRHEVGGIKRGVEPSSMELIPSPQKKTRGPNPDTDRQGKMVELVQVRSLKESCLLVNRVRYDEAVLHEGTMEARDLWDHVEAVSGERESSVLAACASNLAQGGGGWPSTAARSP
ncbi:hypothetical protein ACFX12_041496 [Malus domestica]